MKWLKKAKYHLKSSLKQSPRHMNDAKSDSKSNDSPPQSTKYSLNGNFGGFAEKGEKKWLVLLNLWLCRQNILQVLRKIQGSKMRKISKATATSLNRLPTSQLRRKKIFKYIVKNLGASGILGNLDIYVLTECSICIDRMQTIEKNLNEKDSLDPVLIGMKEKYTKAFFRYCNELCLSPQSRAKLANMNLSEKEENPLLIILNDDDET